MVLITGITKFLPPAEVLNSPLNLKGWHGVRQRAEAKGPGTQLNFKQAVAYHDAFQNPNKDAERQFCYFPVWRLFSPHDIVVAGRGNPIQGPRVGSFLTQKCIVWEDTHADKETLLEGAPGRRAEGAQEDQGSALRL